MTIKATGYTWYWGYEYPDHGDFQFDAIMLQEDELEENQPRLLSTGNALVVQLIKILRCKLQAIRLGYSLMGNALTWCENGCYPGKTE